MSTAGREAGLGLAARLHVRYRPKLALLMLFLDGMYVERADGSLRFRRVR